MIRILHKKPGIQTDDIGIYDTQYENWQLVPVKEMIESGEIDWTVFTSASTVRGFAAAVADTCIKGMKAACIGEQTARAAEEVGMKVYIAEQASAESLVRLVSEHQTGSKL